MALWLALWCCQVKQSIRWHCSGCQHWLVWSCGVFKRSPLRIGCDPETEGENETCINQQSSIGLPYVQGLSLKRSPLPKYKKCGVIYEITCDQDPAHMYIGETKRPLGKRFNKFKEHTNLTIPTGPVGDHCNATGHSVSLDNTKVLTREPQWTKRKVKEAIYIKKSAPSMNREQGYQLPPPIYH